MLRLLAPFAILLLILSSCSNSNSPQTFESLLSNETGATIEYEYEQYAYSSTGTDSLAYQLPMTAVIEEPYEITDDLGNKMLAHPYAVYNQGQKVATWFFAESADHSELYSLESLYYPRGSDGEFVPYVKYWLKVLDRNQSGWEALKEDVREVKESDGGDAYVFRSTSKASASSMPKKTVTINGEKFDAYSSQLTMTSNSTIETQGLNIPIDPVVSKKIFSFVKGMGVVSLHLPSYKITVGEPVNETIPVGGYLYTATGYKAP